ncbi:MAG: trypsin-like peptidase domain-containing protein [Kofleriaceae bacterium]|nr:trypsin-like peptidase domain-containing protein [Kofleriaceae bacterium]
MSQSIYTVSQEPPRVVFRESPATKILAVLLLVVAGALVYTVMQARKQSQGVVALAPRPVVMSDQLGADEKSTIQVFSNVNPSVVHITSIAARPNRMNLDITEIPQGTGTGFIWDTAGHVVTNFHVVQSGNRAQVTLEDGKTYAAKLVGAAPDKDLAVLRIDAPPSKLLPIVVGRSAPLQVGQKVLAIGNPFGLDHTLTTGVISGLGREFKSVTQRSIFDVIQTDASINPGNSGGPLLDSAGSLIGINTAIFSPSGANAGIGFAVPVDTINSIVPELIRNGKISRPALGINSLGDSLAQQLKIEGVVIQDVVPGGGAAMAGLVGVQPASNGQWAMGDVIVALAGIEVKKLSDLHKALDRQKVGDIVDVTVMQNGQKRVVKVTLQPAL